MRLLIASDHAGFFLKEKLVEKLQAEGHQVSDLGPSDSDSVDYPDFASKLCKSLINGDADKGILVCNSGVGMSIAANRYRGVRAALCMFPRMAYYARLHNDANVLVMGAGFTGPFLAGEITDVFLNQQFEGGRHKRRTDKFDN